MDLNPRVHMKCWGGLKGMCGKSLFYSYEEERTLGAKEHFQLLGYPINSVNWDALADCEIRYLAGHGHALQQASLVLCALLVCGNFDLLWEASPA